MKVNVYFIIALIADLCLPVTGAPARVAGTHSRASIFRPAARNGIICGSRHTREQKTTAIENKFYKLKKQSQ
jgi:hypothetical protein